MDGKGSDVQFAYLKLQTHSRMLRWAQWQTRSYKKKDLAFHRARLRGKNKMPAEAVAIEFAKTAVQNVALVPQCPVPGYMIVEAGKAGP